MNFLGELNYCCGTFSCFYFSCPSPALSAVIELAIGFGWSSQQILCPSGPAILGCHLAPWSLGLHTIGRMFTQFHQHSGSMTFNRAELLHWTKGNPHVGLPLLTTFDAWTLWLGDIFLACILLSSYYIKHYRVKTCKGKVKVGRK